MSYTYDMDYSGEGIDERSEADYLVQAHPLMGGNIAGEGAVYDTVPLEMALQNAKALQYALDGTEIDGVLTSATVHDHTASLDSAMPWCQIASWNLHTMQFQDTTLSDPYRLGYVATGTSYTDVLMVPFIVPNLTEVYIVPEFWVKIQNSNVLTIGYDFYNGSDLTTAVASGEVSVGTGSYDGPIKPDELGLDLTSLAGSVAYLKVKTKVSSSTAVLSHVKVRLPFRGAVANPTRVELDTTQVAGDATPSAAKLYKLFVSNPVYLRQSTFGTTLELPTRSAPHDHGEHRGKPLARHQASLSYGPFVFPGSGASSGGTIGIPFVDDTDDDYSATNPKLISHNLIHINGQVERARVYLVAYLAGSTAPRSVGIAVSLRPVNVPYKLYTSGAQIYQTATLSTASDAFVRTTLSFNDLASIGNCGEDRVFELCVWQTSTIASTETYRLCGVCVGALTNLTQELQSEDLSQPATEVVSTMRLLSGQEVSNLLTAQFARVTNQVAREILGGNQGLNRNGSTDNTSKPWIRRIKEVHQHRGSYTDLDGTLVDDGAVIRRELGAQSFVQAQFTQADTTITADDTPCLGWRIHSTGDPDNDEWIRFDTWATIPQGLGAIDIYAALQFETQVARTKLYCVVSVMPEGSDTSIATSVRCGPYEASDNTTIKGSSGEIACEVLPVESPLFASVAIRNARGLGSWTVDALREESRTSNYLRSGCYRVTQPIRVAISPSFTGPYRIRTRWALQTGDPVLLTDGSYDTTARLLSLLAVPSRGY